MFQLDLSASGDLQLYLPTGRPVVIEATDEGISFIKKIILDHRKEVRNQPGYIGTLPTQAAVNKFLAQKKARIAAEKQEETKVKASKLGINLDKLELKL